MIYDYACNHCGVEFEKSLKLKDREMPLYQPCPSCGRYEGIKQIIKSPTRTVDPQVAGRMRPDDTWNNFLKDMKRKNPGSNITTW